MLNLKRRKTPSESKTYYIELDTYWRTTGVIEDLDKIDLMGGFVTDDAGSEYDTRISECPVQPPGEALPQVHIPQHSRRGAITSPPTTLPERRYHECISHNIN